MVDLGRDLRVCAVESAGCAFLVDGFNLRVFGWSGLVAFILARDPEALVEHDTSITSKRLGVAANTADERSPQGILAFAPGHWERPKNDKVDVEAWLKASVGARGE